MNEIEVIVLNSHGVGQYAYTNKMPNWGETLSVTNWHVAEDGGKGTNVAVALGRLGIKTAYIGKVGNDPWGDLGDHWMKNAGVDTTYLYRTDEVATGTGLILIGPNGENSIIDGDSSSVKLTIEEVNTAIDNLSKAKYLVTGFEIPYKVVLEACKHAQSKGIIVALNPSPIPDDFKCTFENVDYLFINSNELNILLDRPQSKEIDLNTDLQLILDRCKCKSVIVTMGEKGSVYFNGKTTIKIEAVKVTEIKNTAGAGDGFMASTIANLCKGKTIEESMIWSSYYSALSITIDGTIPSYRPIKEVEEFIKRYQ